MPVRISWGHQSPAGTHFQVRLLASDAVITDVAPLGLEQDDAFKDGIWRGQAGGGDVDGLELTLRFPHRTVKDIPKPHSIWSHLLANTDASTARRFRLDPGFRPDTRKLTVQMDANGTRGFSVTVDQLLTGRAFWVPALDVFLSAGDPPVSFADHRKALQGAGCRRVLDEVHQEPEATYGQFTARWEDMGSPGYKNPAAPAPGHTVCLTWDSALPKFGIDRGAGVRNDLGNPDHFRFWFDFGDLAQDITASWKGQKLTDALPVVTTTFEKAGVRYEIEQFAYPLNGPPSERRGDIPMVLMQKVRLSELEGRRQSVTVGMTHCRELPAPDTGDLTVQSCGGALVWEDSAAHRVLLAVEGDGLTVQSSTVQGAKPKTNTIRLAVDLPAKGTSEFVVKLPSPLVASSGRQKLLALGYARAREAALKFWEDWLAKGALFDVPDEAVNALFRANLWHALRLPRRHGAQDPNVTIDMPYSNFAYEQRGIPWPVNQAVYVDYMIYDLRGYADVSAEELAAIFRNTQEANGHIKGFADWGVYTPGMLYAVAQHYLLSGDRAGLERLLPQTLKALDWCLEELRRSRSSSGPASGLVLAPLNDLSHDARAWAFNQAYFYAGIDLLGRALAEIRHPRAEDCRSAARALGEAIARAYGHAAVAAPLVQLRDGTWSPYVPGDALTPRRMPEVWYPTDVDTGALHLSRLKALDPRGLLTTCLLHDHEDNLYLKGWGMANEPVYNQQAMTYLLRDDAKAAIRAFYSMMACAFSHSVLEPVEHRWAWGQYFGPPSTDGAWFELYRHMLIHERDDDTILLLQATPRKWLEGGKRIRIERAPTFYGPLSLVVQSRAGAGRIQATIDVPARKQPAALLVRLRHPDAKPIRSVSLNGRAWTDFDVPNEWVRLKAPAPGRYEIVVQY